MLTGFRLTASPSRRIRQTGCGIMGRLIFSAGWLSNLLMMHALVKAPGWSQDFPWIPTWDVIHLIVDYCWGYALDTQICDDTLSWVTLALGSISILGRWRCPCQVSFSLFHLDFAAHKAKGSALLWSSILISALLLALGGTWSYFPLFYFGSGD